MPDAKVEWLARRRGREFGQRRSSWGRAPVGHQSPRADVGEVLIIGAGIGPQQPEGVLDRYVEAPAQETLGLLDDDAACEAHRSRGHHGVRGRVLLQIGTRDVGQGLADEQI